MVTYVSTYPFVLREQRYVVILLSNIFPSFSIFFHDFRGGSVPPPKSWKKMEKGEGPRLSSSMASNEIQEVSSHANALPCSDTRQDTETELDSSEQIAFCFLCGHKFFEPDMNPSVPASGAVRKGERHVEEACYCRDEAACAAEKVRSGFTQTEHLDFVRPGASMTPSAVVGLNTSQPSEKLVETAQSCDQALDQQAGAMSSGATTVPTLYGVLGNDVPTTQASATTLAPTTVSSSKTGGLIDKNDATFARSAPWSDHFPEGAQTVDTVRLQPLDCFNLQKGDPIYCCEVPPQRPFGDEEASNTTCEVMHATADVRVEDVRVEQRTIADPKSKKVVVTVSEGALIHEVEEPGEVYKGPNGEEMCRVFSIAVEDSIVVTKAFYDSLRERAFSLGSTTEVVQQDVIENKEQEVVQQDAIEDKEQDREQSEDQEKSDDDEVSEDETEESAEQPEGEEEDIAKWESRNQGGFLTVGHGLEVKSSTLKDATGFKNAGEGLFCDVKSIQKKEIFTLYEGRRYEPGEELSERQKEYACTVTPTRDNHLSDVWHMTIIGEQVTCLALELASLCCGCAKRVVQQADARGSLLPSLARILGSVRVAVPRSTRPKDPTPSLCAWILGRMGSESASGQRKLSRRGRRSSANTHTTGVTMSHLALSTVTC